VKGDSSLKILLISEPSLANAAKILHEEFFRQILGNAGVAKFREHKRTKPI
jgi:hypothetical protein